jgi:hypothetical protein
MATLSVTAADMASITQTIRTAPDRRGLGKKKSLCLPSTLSERGEQMKTNFSVPCTLGSTGQPETRNVEAQIESWQEPIWESSTAPKWISDFELTLTPF